MKHQHHLNLKQQYQKIAIAVLATVVHATVGCVEACLAGGFLFVLQVVPATKLVANIQEPEQLQMDVLMFFVLGLIVELFVMGILVIVVIVNNLMGEITSNPYFYLIKGGRNYEHKCTGI